MDNETKIPRRNQINQYTPAEKAIWDAVQAVEVAGAHPRLTDAINLLGDALDAVADFVDGTLATFRRSAPSPGSAAPAALVDDIAHAIQHSDHFNGSARNAFELARVIAIAAQPGSAATGQQGAT